jgi:hypothetical protein
LANDKWESPRGDALGKRRTGKDRVFELLVDAIARYGEIPPASNYIPPDITEPLWRQTCASAAASPKARQTTREWRSPGPQRPSSSSAASASGSNGCGSSLEHGQEDNLEHPNNEHP